MTPASFRNPAPHEFHGFHAWAEHLGVETPTPEPEEDEAQRRIRELYANAAKPEDYPALLAHRVQEADGTPAVVPAEVQRRAREAADALRGGHHRRRRRTASGRPAAGVPAPRRDRNEALAATGDAIEELLDLLDVPEEAYEIQHRSIAFFVDEPSAAGYPPLPPGYGYKGGVARKALARTLRLPISTAAVRDIDLLRSADTPPDHDRELAERYMTDDVIHGNAEVEAIVSPFDYFTTREFTVNEVAYLTGAVRITPLGLLDTLSGTIRVTQGHLNRNRGKTHPIVVFKALRFAANHLAEGREPRIRKFRIDFRKRPHPFAFFFALQLSRAFESGADVAGHYVDLARDWNLLEKVDLPKNADAYDAAAALKERLPEYDLSFPV